MKIRELVASAVAASTYCNSWAFEPYAGGDPIEWMARTGLEIFINRDEPYKQSFLERMFERFSIDGAIFHNARTCPNNTNHTIDPALTAIISTVPPDGTYDADGNLLTVNEPRPGEEKYFYLPNMCDKCCWYESAPQVTNETLTTSDDQTYH